MSLEKKYDVFLSYHSDDESLVESLAVRLYGEARLSFWFEPWHAIPGTLVQKQQEDALLQSESCAIFIGNNRQGALDSWQNIQMRTAIQAYVQRPQNFRVIPVLLPDAMQLNLYDLPPYLQLYQSVDFRRGLDDKSSFVRLLAGILNVPPVDINGYIESTKSRLSLEPTPSGVFSCGHALVIAISNYPKINALPSAVLNDGRDIVTTLTDPASSGYPAHQVNLLLDGHATGDNIRKAFANLSKVVGHDDTVVVFFSGHGARNSVGSNSAQYLLPYDCNPADLVNSAISGEEVTSMLRDLSAGRLLVLFDSCYSGGAGDPKNYATQIKLGIGQEFYRDLASSTGRVVIASSRPNEVSYVLPGARNSLFTHYLLEALRGECETIDDGNVRVFDLFRHISKHVPVKADQHPIFKATDMEKDFVIALTHRP